jgi:hypothetical protein
VDRFHLSLVSSTVTNVSTSTILATSNLNHAAETGDWEAVAATTAAIIRGNETRMSRVVPQVD